MATFIAKLKYSISLPISQLIGSHCVTSEECSALVLLIDKLGSPQGSQDDIVQSFAEISMSLFHKSNEIFPGSTLTFNDIHELIIKLLTPVKKLHFGTFDIVASAAEPLFSIPRVKKVSFLVDGNLLITTDLTPKSGEKTRMKLKPKLVKIKN